jgi:hypothetical protein
LCRASARASRLLVSRRTKPSGGVLLDFLDNVGTPSCRYPRDYRLNESANSPARSSSGLARRTRSRPALDSLPTAARRCGGEAERKKKRRGNERDGRMTDPSGTSSSWRRLFRFAGTAISSSSTAITVSFAAPGSLEIAARGGYN